MNELDLKTAHDSVDQRVRVYCTDGEILDVKVHLVSDEERDIICDVISTNRPKRHIAGGGNPACSVKFDDIERVEPLP